MTTQEEYHISPFPELKNVLYINDERIAEYFLEPEEMQSDDDISVYVPFTLSKNAILCRMYAIYEFLGNPNDYNQSNFYTAMGSVISQLEVYNYIRADREPEQCAFFGEIGQALHPDGIALAKEMIDYMLENEGCADTYPYDEIEEIKKTFGL